MSAQRPNPVQWIGYSFGRTLPDSMRDWVRNDLTGPRAATRHVLRSQVPMIPIYALLALLPGPWQLRAATVGLGVMLAIFYSVAYMAQNRRKRLERHGLDPELRTEAVIRRREEERRAYEATFGPRPGSTDSPTQP